jgi:hypothetical protein
MNPFQKQIEKIQNNIKKRFFPPMESFSTGNKSIKVMAVHKDQLIVGKDGDTISIYSIKSKKLLKEKSIPHTWLNLIIKDKKPMILTGSGFEINYWTLDLN